MPVKVMDAGSKIMLSSSSRDEVATELDKRIKEGARKISDPYQLGSNWIAACGLPPQTAPQVDDTTTLRFSDFAPPAGVEDEDLTDDGCRVEELGFKRIVTGPSKQAVQRRFEHMKRFGASLQGEIEEQDGAWVAVVDTGGADKVFRF